MTSAANGGAPSRAPRTAMTPANGRKETTMDANGKKKARRLWLALLALTAVAALAVIVCGEPARDLPKGEDSATRAGAPGR